MKKALFLLSTALCLTTVSAFGQDVQKKLDKLAKDPKTAENAAKADVYISNKKRITDSATKTERPATVPNNKKKGRKSCKHE